MDPWCAAADVKARPGMDGLTDDEALTAATIASQLLFSLSGGQFGISTVTVRPEGCGRSCDWGPPSEQAVVGWGMALPLATILGPWPLPGPAGGMGVIAQCGGCGGWSTAGVDLRGPVVWDGDHALTVTVDGTDLPSDGSAWVLVDMRRIIRVDGGTIPQCQDLRVAVDQPGTCQVVYSRGTAVPMAGVQAAISLAVQYALLQGWVDGECKLPQRVTSIVRQGVTAVAIDPLTIISDGGTGLTDVDLWLVSVNPAKLRRRARIYTPGMPNPLPSVTTGAS